MDPSGFFWLGVSEGILAGGFLLVFLDLQKGFLTLKQTRVCSSLYNYGAWGAGKGGSPNQPQRLEFVLFAFGEIYNFDFTS